MVKTTLFAFTSSHTSAPMLMSRTADSKFLVAEPVFCSTLCYRGTLIQYGDLQHSTVAVMPDHAALEKI